MKLGDFQLFLLSDGTFRLDGGLHFGIVPRVLWQQWTRPDRRNRILLGLNCLLIKAHGKYILVDTGVGTKEPQKIKRIYGGRFGKLLSNLKALGLEPQAIDYVIPHHLHFDHAGGCTVLDKKGRAVPTFPRATYLVQKASWEDAVHPNERSRASYHPDDFLPLEEGGQLALLQGDSEVVPGVKLVEIGGHCRGLQGVMVTQGPSTAAFLGDILPHPLNLPLPFITALDQFPEDTLEKKRYFLRRAEEERWLLVFSHGHEQRAGYVERQGDRLILKPVEIPAT